MGSGGLSDALWRVSLPRVKRKFFSLFASVDAVNNGKSESIIFPVRGVGQRPSRKGPEYGSKEPACTF